MQTQTQTDHNATHRDRQTHRRTARQPHTKTSFILPRLKFLLSTQNYAAFFRLPLTLLMSRFMHYAFMLPLLWLQGRLQDKTRGEERSVYVTWGMENTGGARGSDRREENFTPVCLSQAIRLSGRSADGGRPSMHSALGIFQKRHRKQSEPGVHSRHALADWKTCCLNDMEYKASKSDAYYGKPTGQ